LGGLFFIREGLFFLDQHAKGERERVRASLSPVFPGCSINIAALSSSSLERPLPKERTTSAAASGGGGGGERRR